MNTMITIPMWQPSLLVVASLGAGAAIALWFDRSRVREMVDGFRLLSATDEQAARWLVEHGYRKDIEHPDITGEIEAVHVEAEPRALSDRPAEDEDEVGDEQPGEVASRLLVPVLWVARRIGALIGLCEAAYDRLAEQVAEIQRSWQSRNRLDGDEVPLGDPFEQFRIDDNPRGRTDAMRQVLAASGYDVRTDEQIAAEIAELTGETMAEAQQIEVAAIIDAHRRKTLYLPTGAHPMVTLPGVEGGRHRKPEAEDAESVEAVA